MAVEILTSENFSEKIKNADKPVIVDFYADWCMPCKMVAPILEDISSNNPEVIVYKVNVDETGDVAQQFQVTNIPTMISFKNGEVHKKSVGALPKESILELAQ